MAKLRYHLTFIDEESELSTESSRSRFQSCPPSVCRGNWEWPSELQVPLGRGLGYFGVGEVQRNAVNKNSKKKTRPSTIQLQRCWQKAKQHPKVKMNFGDKGAC